MKKPLILAILITALLIYVGRGPLLRNSARLANSGFAPVEDLNDFGDAASELAGNLHGNPPPRHLSPADSIIVKKGSMPKRSSFFVEMQKAGVSPVEIDKIVRACRKTFNLKKVRPGQKYSVFSSSGGGLDSLDYFINRDKILKVRRSNEQFLALIDTLYYRINYQVIEGTIDNSLFASLQKEGADPELAGSLALIFGWVIDFFKDIRSGDTFTILYEKKTYEDGVTILGSILAARVVTQGRAYYAFRYKSPKRSWGYYDLHGKSLQKTLLRTPLKFTRITSSFRRKRLHPVTHSYRPHLGVDYGAPYGTPVHATGDGTVVAAMRNKANGNYVKIRHNRSYTTYYLHLSRFARGIRKGRKVKQGQVIGYVGSSGIATGSHLDYRIKVNGRFVNPRTIKLPSKSPVPPAELLAFRKRRDAALSRFLEASGRGSEGKTILVEKPVYLKSILMEELF